MWPAGYNRHLVKAESYYQCNIYGIDYDSFVCFHFSDQQYGCGCDFGAARRNCNYEIDRCNGPVCMWTIYRGRYYYWYCGLDYPTYIIVCVISACNSFCAERFVTDGKLAEPYEYR